MKLIIAEKKSVGEAIAAAIGVKEKQKTIPNAANMTPKKKAFLELQKMRKEGAKYDFSAEDRAVALDEKYGAFVWNGGTQ